MLRNPYDAEDLVQETLLAWLSEDRKGIANIKGYLVRTLINKCLNFLRKRKREQGTEIAPELTAEFMPALVENRDSISLILLQMMERLTPLERAVYLLKEIFDYSHKEIAALLEISEIHSRQLLSRAKKHLAAEESRFAVDTHQHQALFEMFVAVCQGQDMQQLIDILRKDVKLYEKGRLAASGPQAVAAHWQGLIPSSSEGLSFHLAAIQGLPALLVCLWDYPLYQISLDTDGRHIHSLKIQTPYLTRLPMWLAPEKHPHLTMG